MTDPNRVDRIEDYLRNKLQDKRQSVMGFMAGGQAKDHAEYRHLCGILQGLEFADNLIVDLAKRLLEDADD